MAKTEIFVEFKRIIRIVIFFLGVYEFYSIFTLLQIRDHLTDSSERFILLHPEVIIENPPAFYLLLIFYFYLGINRITWAVTSQFYPDQNHFYPWLQVVLTHFAELFLFYSLAFLPQFNSQQLNVVQLITKVAALEIGNKQSRMVLLVVPLILLLLVIHGPTVEKASLKVSQGKKPSKSS